MFEAMKKKKKGQMVGLSDIPGIVITFGIATIVIGAIAITLGQFQSSTTNAAAINAITNGTAGLTAIAQQFPTLGVIVVMAIIIGVISGIWVYFRGR